MGSHPRTGIDRQVEGALGPEAEGPEGDVPYFQSCHVYAHEPPCPTYLAHLRRLKAERDAAGGEAALKARVKFWDRL